MTDYRVYFIDRSDHILQAQNFEAEDDSQAIAMAEVFCRQHPDCDAIEIWQRARRVHRHDRAA